MIDRHDREIEMIDRCVCEREGGREMANISPFNS